MRTRQPLLYSVSPPRARKRRSPLNWRLLVVLGVNVTAWIATMCAAQVMLSRLT
jgi:uncharacterized membrane-anchored protein